MKHEKQMMQLAESAMTENENLRAKLKAAESARDALEQKLQAMSHEASDWEAALDGLQVPPPLFRALDPAEGSTFACLPACPATTASFCIRHLVMHSVRSLSGCFLSPASTLLGPGQTVLLPGCRTSWRWRC